MYIEYRYKSFMYMRKGWRHISLFFFSCTTEVRDELFDNVLSIADLNVVNTHILLLGDDNSVILWMITFFFIINPKDFDYLSFVYLHLYQNVLTVTLL